MTARENRFQHNRVTGHGLMPIVLFGILFGHLMALSGCAPRNEWAEMPGAGNPTIQAILRDVACQHRIVGMGAGIVRTTGDPNLAVVGWNKAGTKTPIRLDDLWHLGSCSKAMTATLAAKLVEEGKLNWHTTIGGVFPELATKLNPDKCGIALEELLSHRSGLRHNPSPFVCLFNLCRSPAGQRNSVLRHLSTAKLVGPPGTQYSYSNFGYILAGAMIERIIHQPFEDIMRAHLFEPLGMLSPEYEGTHVFGESGVIWSHWGCGRPAARWIALVGDPPLLRPAGCVRCTLGDWARFIQHHLIGERGDSNYLKVDTYQELHRSRGDNYALGWAIEQRDWGDGTVLQHAGSNGLNYSVVWIAPRKGFAVFVCANQGECYQALDEVATRLIDQICGTNLVSNSSEKQEKNE